MAAPYNYNPSPRQGRGAFGTVPGIVTLPPNLYEGVQSIYPGLTGNTNLAGNVVRHQLSGELSPETINTIQDDAARFGVTSGMPLSNLSGYRGLRNLGRTVEDVQSKGLENYNKLLSTLGPMMTDPALAAQIAAWNATMGAAPDPRLNADEMMRRYREGLGTGLGARNPSGGTYRPPGGDLLNGPAGGTGGGPFMITGGGGPGSNIRRPPTILTPDEPQDFWTGGYDWWQTPEGASDWLFYGGEPGGFGTDWSDLNSGITESDFGPYSGGYEGLGGDEGNWWDTEGGASDWLFYGGDGGEGDFGPYSGGYEGLGGDTTDWGSDWGSEWDTWLGG